MVLSLLLACAADSVGALSDQCADCHATQADALAASTLSREAPTALFTALQAQAAALHGPSAAAQCDACHAPVVGHQGGLSCASCHAAVGQRAPENGALIHELWGPVLGTESLSSPAHRVQSSVFLGDPALCGTCHELQGPAALSETPYTHWRDSPAAQDGVGCADCHMPQGDHSFPGLNGDRDTALSLLREAAELERIPGGVRLHNRNPGHALPDGAAFTRRLVLQWRLDGQVLGEHSLTPSYRDAQGEEIHSPLAAAAHQDNSIPAGQSRDFFPPSEVTPARACLVFQQQDPALLAELGLPEAGGEGEVGCLGW